MLLLLFRADLTLAAELGKTLLERNKELESQLTDYQRAYAEQTQEITVSIAGESADRLPARLRQAGAGE